jgi:SAM-dependent methyltransferase/uncharacterized protein YbaR (Trm112 family)
MKEKYLKILICPRCNGPFSPNKDILSRKGEIIRGLLKCSCSGYPILEGIPILVNNSTSRRVAGFYNKYGARLSGREIPFFLFQRNIPDLAIFLVLRTGFFQKLSLRQFLIVMLLSGGIKPRWFLYLTARVSPSINSAAKLATASRKVIDLGCGPGHFLKKLRNNPFNIGVDFNLLNLYLAKKYIAPRSGYVYADLNRPLPFNKKIFDFAVVNDTLHYVRAQRLLAQEISRILKPKSIIFLGHVHNSLAIDPGSSRYPLTLNKCRELFKGFVMSSYRERGEYLVPVAAEKSNRLTFLNLLFSRGVPKPKAFR